MTHDELEALKKASQGCEAFQTKSKIFEEGWKAHTAYVQSKPSVLRDLRDSAIKRDLELILTCAREVANAMTNSSLYIARERLRKVLEYFNKPDHENQSQES